MNWNIAKAKKSFSQVIRKAIKEPQIIYNRDKIVAAIINPKEYKEYMAYRKTMENDSLDSAFDELRDICAEENYSIIIPARSNREVKLP